MPTTPELTQKIEKLISENSVFVFMKGEKDEPMCGFSALVVNIMKQMNQDYGAYNILEDPEMRQGIKEYTDWPTIPQVFIHGEFIGGSDILQEMYLSGDLEKLLQNKSA